MRSFSPFSLIFTFEICNLQQMWKCSHIGECENGEILHPGKYRERIFAAICLKQTPQVPGKRDQKNHHPQNQFKTEPILGEIGEIRGV